MFQKLKVHVMLHMSHTASVDKHVLNSDFLHLYNTIVN